MFGRVVDCSSLLKHARFLSKANPDMSFERLSGKDIDILLKYIYFLLKIKAGGFYHKRRLIKVNCPTVDRIGDRNLFFEKHKNELQSFHPEFDFDNLSKREKETIEDDLDSMMYAKDIMQISKEFWEDVDNRNLLNELRR